MDRPIIQKQVLASISAPVHARITGSHIPKHIINTPIPSPTPSPNNAKRIVCEQQCAQTFSSNAGRLANGQASSWRHATHADLSQLHKAQSQHAECMKKCQ